ncbi:MAG: putative glycoside hydrolase [Acidimicrobiia bacterium]
MSPAALLLALLLLGGCTLGVEGGQRTATGSEQGGVGREVDEASVTTTLPLAQLLGEVVDAGDDPVPGATVTVGERTAISAADGWFDILASPGPLRAEKPGWVGTEMAWDGSSAFIEVGMEPLRIHGLRVSAEAAGDDAKFSALLTLADETAINTLVFDTKQEGGRVFYDTKVMDAHDSGAVLLAYDPAQRVAQAKEHGLYAITRIVTFEDSYRAKAHPEEAYDDAWINPTIASAWEYPLALAEEACGLGFDEIQFDYVRFPSGSTVELSGQLDMTQAERIAAIEGFLREARTRLHAVGCAVSADVFGIVVSAENDQGIGQRPEELSHNLDAFSPMIYPSHYSNGWLGFDDPNEHPYDVTSAAIEDAAARIEPGVVLRPWLQAFWWTNEEIRRSIQAAEDHGVGWILWNAVSNFDREAIPTDAELASP